MEINLKEISTGKVYEGQILECPINEMPIKKDSWQFNWRKLSKIEGAIFFKITLKDSPKKIEGMLMLTLLNDEMLYMNNIEVAPHNYGNKDKYDNVAGSMIAYACRTSFELGKGYYLGFLSFDSKTELISLYQKKHGATHAMGQKMFINPEIGKWLMEKYLNIFFNKH